MHRGTRRHNREATLLRPGAETHVETLGVTMSNRTERDVVRRHDRARGRTWRANRPSANASRPTRAVQELRSGPARVPEHLEARDLTRRGTPDTDGPTGGGAPSGNGDIYTECLPRTATTDGLIIATFTPLRGLTPFVDRYLETALRPDAAGLLINANPARPHLLLVEPEPSRKE
jgi:phage terminase large subunit-like protein